MNLFQQIIPNIARHQASVEPVPATAPAAAPPEEYTAKPAFEINERPEAWAVTVHLPGVTKDALEITAEEDQITIRGRRAWQKPEGWTSLYRETADATYLLKLEHDNALDISAIRADLKDGVLELTLPKAEARKVRKISVN
jgi:HSP20 family protein